MASYELGVSLSIRGILSHATSPHYFPHTTLPTHHSPLATIPPYRRNTSFLHPTTSCDNAFNTQRLFRFSPA
ncbi:hypothetical protein IAQ61_011490 [Plenodomus lingam]|uniref:uncharacterized protein n=1 Tax=Leptosphaeria maculans TaxID=5022 RepID=UPI00331B4559|nr:hypothetical protein IAQ61_011490 [Plenodomus lingam]